MPFAYMHHTPAILRAKKILEEWRQRVRNRTNIARTLSPAEAV
jgi:hypothetical protein